MRTRTHVNHVSMAVMPSLHNLPNEILLSVLVHIHSISEEKQRTLRNLSFTYKRVRPLAQEVLLQEPCARLHGLPSLVESYTRNDSAAQARRVTSLEICALQQDGCACAFWTRHTAFRVLKAFKKVLEPLPNLYTLLLGKNRMQDITSLHHLFIDKRTLFCTYPGFTSPFLPNAYPYLDENCWTDLVARITKMGSASGMKLLLEQTVQSAYANLHGLESGGIRHSHSLDRLQQRDRVHFNPHEFTQSTAFDD